MDTEKAKTNVSDIKEETWQTFNSTADRFGVLFPYYPTFNSASETIGRILWTYNTYTSKKDNVTFIVEKNIFSEPDTLSPDSQLENMVNDFLKNSSGSTLVSQKYTYYDSYRTLDFLVQMHDSSFTENRYVKVRVILIDQKTYFTLTAIYSESNYNNTDYEKFINSFNITTSSVSNSTEPLVISPPEGQKNSTSLSGGFASMTKDEKDRITKIIDGVVSNSIAVTEVIKKEVANIFTKYAITDEEIEWFKVYGPAVMENYTFLLYADALQSLQTGVPLKSVERQKIADFAIDIGKLTKNDIQNDNLDLEKIAKEEPVSYGDGETMIVTEKTLKFLFNNQSDVLSRINSLFAK